MTDRTLELCWDEGYVAPAYGFDTTRKSARLVERLAAAPRDDVRVVAPSDADRADAVAAIERLHDPAYVAALRTGDPAELAESQGFTWDPGIWTMAVHSTAGVLRAVDRALAVGAAGSLSSGLHHARRDRGAGFCTVNGLVAGIERALARLDAAGVRDPSGRPLDVVLLDVDAHFGGGTHDLLRARPDLADRTVVIDLSTDPYDAYRPDVPDATVVLWPDDVADDYLDTLSRLLRGVHHEGTGLVLVNAGMDPFPAVDREVLTARERTIAGWCAAAGTPLAFVLAGGYTVSQTLDELVDLHLTTVAAVADVAPALAAARAAPSGDARGPHPGPEDAGQ
jgi:acetoin utilization deacetylase AcuC-like enzyme